MWIINYYKSETLVLLSVGVKTQLPLKWELDDPMMGLVFVAQCETAII